MEEKLNQIKWTELNSINPKKITVLKDSNQEAVRLTEKISATNLTVGGAPILIVVLKKKSHLKPEK